VSFLVVPISAQRSRATNDILTDCKFVREDYWLHEKQDVVFEHLMNVIFYAALVLSFVLAVCLIGISLAGIAHLWDKYANKNKRVQRSNE
jgi:hypothetical protein